MLNKFMYWLTGKKPAPVNSVCTPCGTKPEVFDVSIEEYLPIEGWFEAYNAGKKFSRIQPLNDVAITEGLSPEEARKVLEDVYRREICVNAQSQVNTAIKYDPCIKDYVS